MSRSFSMGKEFDIIGREEVKDCDESISGSTISLRGLRTKPTFEKTLAIVARNLIERLLPYFITDDYICPEIVLYDSDESSEILLNDFVRNEISGHINEIPVEQGSFVLNSNERPENF